MPDPRLSNLIRKARREGWAQRIRSAADEHAVLNGCYFDQAAADHVVEFFRKFLKHSKGDFAGKPFELLGWQRDDIIEPLFGWKRADATRRYRIAYVEIPKKNGKSTLAAGIGLYLLVGDGEAGAEVYSTAVDREQANIVHGEAVSMVDASVSLSKALTVNRSTFNILHPKSRSWYRSLSGEAESKEGLNAHGIVIDELHAWKGRKLWGALEFAGRGRKQPLRFVITTAGDDVTSVCREQHEYAQDVIAGRVFDDRFFGYIRAAAESDDLDAEDTWHRANPSMGITIDPAEFASDLKQAKRTPSGWSRFKRYSFNVWATNTNPAIKEEHWNACAEDFAPEELAGRECYGAIDLGRVNDMSALVLVFPDGDGEEVDEAAQAPKDEAEAELLQIAAERFLVVPYFWLPEATVNDPEGINTPKYQQWVEQGFIEAMPGDTVDYRFIEQRIVEIKGRFDFRSLSYDPMYADDITQRLAEDHGILRIEFPPIITHFAKPTAAFERLIVAGNLRHNRHPVLSWHVMNLNFKTDANNNRRPIKPPNENHRKVDGAVSLIMALSRAMLRDRRTSGRSVYEEREMVIL